MADWDNILLERRLLWWATFLVLLGTGLWVIALATPYWLILIPGPELSQIDTPSNLTSSFINRKVVWAYSGIWRKCQLVELYHSNYDVRMVRWECWTLVTLSAPASLIRAELSVAGAGALISVAACVFSWAAIRHPHYTYRRVSAFLHLLTAITTLTVIQLVDGGASAIMSVAQGDSLLYGYSFLLAWVTFLFSLAASITFLAASRKRKLLDNDNVNFTHQKLDISIPQN